MDPLSSSSVGQYQGLRASRIDLTPTYNVPHVKEKVTGDGKYKEDPNIPAQRSNC